MEYLIVFWILGAVLTGHLGTDKRIGYWNTFLTSLFLSPLIGALAAVSSKDKEDIKREKETLNTLTQILEQLKDKAPSCIVFLFITISIFSCTPKKQDTSQDWEFVKEGNTSKFGDFNITLLGISIRNSIDYGGRYNTNNKYIILELTYTNVSNSSKRLCADGILGSYNQQNVLFDDNRIIGNNYELTVNPGVTETIDIAYKVPVNLHGTLDFLPYGDIKKAIQFTIDNVEIKG